MEQEVARLLQHRSSVCVTSAQEFNERIAAGLVEVAGLFSAQFTFSTPPNGERATRKVEVRLIRIRKQADGTFVREGGVELLIP